MITKYFLIGTVFSFCEGVLTKWYRWSINCCIRQSLQLQLPSSGCWLGVFWKPYIQHIPLATYHLLYTRLTKSTQPTTLKMANAKSAETLDNFQHLMQLIPKN
jgi:hypothetical protein